MILEKIRSKECLENLDTNQMSRIQRYLNNIVIIPLYQRNFNLDEESLGSSDYQETASGLATASIEAKSNLSVVSNSLRSDCEFKCDASDFQKKTGDFLLENPKRNKTIKCRIKKYLLGNNIFDRPYFEIEKLSNNLDFVNQIRLQTESVKINGQSPTESSNKNRVYGFTRVYDFIDNSFIKIIKGCNNNTPYENYFDDFAPVIKPPTVYDSLVLLPDESQSIPNPTRDAEIRMLEYIAKEFKLKDIKIELFTDRVACTSCENVLNNINTITSNIHIKDKPILLGIYLSGESIPTPRDKYFYSNLIKEK